MKSWGWIVLLTLTCIARDVYSSENEFVKQLPCAYLTPKANLSGMWLRGDFAENVQPDRKFSASVGVAVTCEINRFIGIQADALYRTLGFSLHENALPYSVTDYGSSGYDPWDTPSPRKEGEQIILRHRGFSLPIALRATFPLSSAQPYVLGGFYAEMYWLHAASKYLQSDITRDIYLFSYNQFGHGLHYGGGLSIDIVKGSIVLEARHFISRYPLSGDSRDGLTLSVVDYGIGYSLLF
ncbi:MAG: outer membrane beta-barrel protein [Chitinivibrionales bacterium]|nr:outer membrane beta-barrel protein [Chitinivibrionales bacterium]